MQSGRTQSVRDNLPQCGKRTDKCETINRKLTLKKQIYLCQTEGDFRTKSSEMAKATSKILTYIPTTLRNVN